MISIWRNFFSIKCCTLSASYSKTIPQESQLLVTLKLMRSSLTWSHHWDPAFVDEVALDRCWRQANRPLSIYQVARKKVHGRQSIFHKSKSCEGLPRVLRGRWWLYRREVGGGGKESRKESGFREGMLQESPESLGCHSKKKRNCQFIWILDS